MKTWTSILAAGAILAFAAPVGSAAIDSMASNASGKQVANVKHVKKHAKHSAIRVGYGPYAYLGDTAPVGANSPYAYLGNTAPVGFDR